MRNDALDKLIWTLIFGGGLVAAFGVSLAEQDTAAGAAVTALGLGAVGAGVVLIWWRSRRGP